MIIVVFAIAALLDVVVACMVGTVFFTMWHWLIIPMFEPAIMVTWSGAVIVVFVLSYLTKGGGDDIGEIEGLRDLFESCQVLLCNKGVSCLIQISLTFLLWLFLV